MASPHPWRDGTTAFVFDPVAFLSRLAVLVPRPRVNPVLYYGVRGARAAWRRDVVAGAGREGAGAKGCVDDADDTAAALYATHQSSPPSECLIGPYKAGQSASCVEIGVAGAAENRRYVR